MSQNQRPKTNKIVKTMVAMLAAFSLAPTTVHAAKGDQGVDWSKYQGTHGKFGYGSDKFAIAQLGGYYDGYFVVQSTYATQVQYAIAQGKRAHTYIYSQFSSTSQAKQMLNYYLPKVQTPAGSIVALDVESGTPNTSAVEYALKRVKDAGYTAVLYGYKNFLTSHLNLSSIARTYPLWLAEYPNYAVTRKPNYNYFPSYKNIGIFQFTSTYVTGGLDGNIDLTGITDKGYTNSDKAKVKTPAVAAGQKAQNTSKSKIKVGDTVKINLDATKWTTGQSIIAAVKGKAYKVKQINGSKLLLAGVNSWISRDSVQIVSVGNPVITTTVKQNYFTWRPTWIYTRKTVRAHTKLEEVGTNKEISKTYKAKTKLKVKALKNNRFELTNGMFVSANKSYVNNLYFTNSTKGVKRVRSIGGTYTYTDLAFSKRNKGFKQGTQFDVAKVIPYGKISRLALANGNYVSANKLVNSFVK